MYTIGYKGFYINGYFDRAECHVVKDGVGRVATCKSLHAAKCFITTGQGPAHWLYRGVNIYPAGVNSSGVRWVTIGGLKADSKRSMRELINHYKGAHHVN